MGSYWLDGAIPAGAEVVLTNQTGGQLAVLAGYTDSSGAPQLLFDTSPLTSGGTLLKFQLTGNLQQALFGTTGSGALGYNQSNQAALTINPASLVPVQSIYAPWGGPFLAGVPYQLKNQVGKILTFPMGQIDSQGQATITGSTDKVLVLPSLWYFGCQAGQPGLENTEAKGSVLSAYCALNPGATACTGIQTQGWTDLSDCEAGPIYSYCSVNQYCSAACKGPCASNFDDCTYNPNSGFSCQFDPNDLFKGQWWRQPWFIYLCLLVLGLLLLLVLVWYFRRLG